MIVTSFNYAQSHYFKDLVGCFPYLGHPARSDEVVEAVATADEPSGLRAERRVLAQLTAPRGVVATSRR